MQICKLGSPEGPRGLTAVTLLGNKTGYHSSLAPTCNPPQHVPPPSLTHQVLLRVLDGLGVVPHEAHGEEEVNDSKDGVQPKEVVARGGHHLPSGLDPQGRGWGSLWGLATLRALI